MLAMVATTIDFKFGCVLFLIWFLSTLLVRSLIKKHEKSKEIVQHPPSPPALPIIGHLHLLGSGLPKSFQTLASRFGPLMRIQIGASTSFVVSNATVAKEVFKTHDLSFACRPEFGSSEYSIYKASSSFFNAEYGTYWRFMKKICMTKLLSAPQLNRFADIRKQEMTKFLETLVKCSKDAEACNLGAEIMTMTNNTICRMAMSTRCSGNDNQSKMIWEFVQGLQQLVPKIIVGEMLGPLKRFDLLGSGRRLRALLMQYDTLIEEIIMEHEKERKVIGGERRKKDMMDIILEISEDESAEIKITRNDIKAFFLDIFLGGTETTSTVMQWALAELINHPEVFKKLREEINTVVGSTRLVQELDVPNLPYLQAVVKESLRLHPTVPLIPRKCRKDCKINDYDILANSRLIINVYAIMRDPNLWEDPLEFVPERFLVSSIEKHGDHENQERMKDQNFKYLPFGGGRRGCPGATLAYTILHVMIAMLVQCFDWKFRSGEKVDMEEGSGFSCGMAHPLVCCPITRVNPLEVAVFTN
ncbi:hypothetical protein F0562_017164 [Nyssa sinensis]|uniref:Uncharacterized protein n=1 Tax=Nyssa sinensis TaxID=561372 RepID=A0A5J4ZHK0_9ASTE|nr:hypothetical protein F0562_017164 [Nyssa sinensis]